MCFFSRGPPGSLALRPIPDRVEPGEPGKRVGSAFRAAAEESGAAGVNLGAPGRWCLPRRLSPASH